MRPAPQQLRASVWGQFVEAGHGVILAHSTDSRARTPAAAARAERAEEGVAFCAGSAGTGWSRRDQAECEQFLEGVMGISEISGSPITVKRGIC
ncbi:hypothetical protein SAV14893_093040 [Streptomyces avermitilis]|uniref:Uncharacterized protein n=1 Tax=Streptomyces avermitilis TaxID=33903 RepID=A0A4D4MD99_STRAX|nr:hypothetical protein SAV14893_093040 [Streptomyces avermitilis]